MRYVRHTESGCEWGQAGMKSHERGPSVQPLQSRRPWPQQPRLLGALGGPSLLPLLRCSRGAVFSPAPPPPSSSLLPFVPLSLSWSLLPSPVPASCSPWPSSPIVLPRALALARVMFWVLPHSPPDAYLSRSWPTFGGFPCRPPKPICWTWPAFLHS